MQEILLRRTFAFADVDTKDRSSLKCKSWQTQCQAEVGSCALDPSSPGSSSADACTASIITGMRDLDDRAFAVHTVFMHSGDFAYVDAWHKSTTVPTCTKGERASTRGSYSMR